MMVHAKGRGGRVNHPFHHLSVYVRPTKQALKEAAAESKATASTEAPASTSTPETVSAKPVETEKQTKKTGWWPFGQKEQASL
jgi:hypothetical protein